MPKVKIHSFRESIYIAFMLISLVCGVMAAILLSLANGNDGLYISGMIISMIALILVVSAVISLINETTVYLDSETIIVKSFFFHVTLKQERWTDLQKTEIRRVNGGRGGNVAYICLFFNNQGMSLSLKDVTSTTGVVMVVPSKKNRKILREYLPDDMKANLDVKINDLDKKEVDLYREKRKAAKKKTKLFMYGDLVGKGAIIITAIPLSISMIAFIIGAIMISIDNNKIFDTLFIAGGSLMFVFMLIFLLVLLYVSRVIIVDADSIGTTTVFRENIIEEKWSNLQKVEVKHLEWIHNGEYLCLWFKNLIFNSNNINELMKLEGIMLVALTDKNKQVLMKYMPEIFKSILYTK